MGKEVQIEIPMDVEIMGYEHTLRLGGPEEIREVINHEWLSQTVISSYMRYYIKI